MKRYNQDFADMELADDGEWIRYSDHCETMKRIAGAPVAQGLTRAQIGTLNELLQCFMAWEPQVRVLGNVRADDAADAVRAILAQAAPSASAQRAEPVADKPLWQSYMEQQVEKELKVLKDALCGEDYAADFDDLVVDNFATAMKGKLAKAREKGRGGWQQCKPADLSRMLREHVEKGDPRDVANFCMFLWSMGKPISAVPAPSAAPAAPTLDGMTRTALNRAIDALLTVGRDVDERRARQCQRDIDEIRVLLAASPADQGGDHE